MENQKNFWQKLDTPFTILAPMDGVTDTVFREIISEIGKPDVLVTEFANTDALNSKGREETLKRFKFTKNQHPIVAQIWGTDPDNFYETAKLVVELGFDGIDINMGCPVRTVMTRGAGAALINTPKLAKELIEAVKKGTDGEIPVSVKTRIGVNKIVTEDWISFLLNQDIAALAIHVRTAKEQSKVPARWEEFEKIVRLRNKIAPETILIGNGDINTYKDVLELHEEYGLEGLMIGRGIFSNPWIFKNVLEPEKHSTEEYLKLLLKHAKLYKDTWKDTKNFEVMKKFFKVYVKKFNGANELRQKLMECKTYEEVEEVIQGFLRE